MLSIGALMLASGAYLLILVLSPQASFIIRTPNTLNTSNDATDLRNRIQIEKINLEVTYGAGGEEQLDKGAWWRYPERGNPIKGGNFILSAHRFYLGLTPSRTLAKSPFYRLEEVEVNDQIKVFYEGEWFQYKVVDKYTVKPDAVEIEDPSQEAKMTLYTCTLGGAADGRVVIEAVLSS